MVAGAGGEGRDGVRDALGVGDVQLGRRRGVREAVAGGDREQVVAELAATAGHQERECHQPFARAFSFSHHGRFSRYHRTVLARPSAKSTLGA